MRITENIFLILVLCASIVSCNNTPDKSLLQDSETDNISRQVFLIGKGPNSKETVKDMIEKSGIKKGGYVVILSLLQNKKNSASYYLKKEFNDRQIMAVHVLVINSNEEIKNTDVLAIENARILCFLDENRNKFIKIANKSRLKKSLLNAYKNGTLIAGFGKGASILGEYYYKKVTDTVSQKVKVVLKPGLGLLTNTVIDDITFMRNYKKGIQKNSAKKKFVFLGLGYKSAIWIKNEEAIVIRKSEVGLISPDKAIETLQKGDDFTIFSR